MFKRLQKFRSMVLDQTHFMTQKVAGYPDLHARFARNLGYSLNIRSPQTFNEWIQRRKISDRSSLRARLADKLGMRAYLVERLGREQASRLMVPVLAVAPWPSEIDFGELPDGFVLKANHGSGFNHIVYPGQPWSQEELISRAEGWLVRSYGRYKVERCYTGIKRRVFVEKLLIDETGEIPLDFKLYMFFGKCAFVLVRDPQGRKAFVNLYTCDWERLAVRRGEATGSSCRKPTRFGEMVKLAELLSKDLDFVRVDFLSSGDQIFVGELTNYPGSGFTPFYPFEFDLELGALFGPAGRSIAEQGFQFLQKYTLSRGSVENT